MVNEAPCVRLLTSKVSLGMFGPMWLLEAASGVSQVQVGAAGVPGHAARTSGRRRSKGN